MTVSNMSTARMRSASDEPPPRKPVGNCGPMSQQSPLGAHGHDMHPQEFVRLIGCSDQNRQSQTESGNQSDLLRPR
jgi:hypothetical protein